VLARPCQRCIKRGIADNCIEGHRKKAKYLLDEEELGTFLVFFPCYCILRANTLVIPQSNCANPNLYVPLLSASRCLPARKGGMF